MHVDALFNWFNTVFFSLSENPDTFSTLKKQGFVNNLISLHCSVTALHFVYSALIFLCIIGRMVHFFSENSQVF